MKRGEFTRRAFSLAAVHHRVGSGNRASMTYGNGVQTEYTYNKANLVSYLSNTKNAAVLSQYSYTYDLAGQQVSKTDHGGQQTAYTYNGIGQLTGEVQSQNSTNMHQYSYQYSAAQNRTQMDLDGVTTAYTYDVNNRLLTQTVGTAATNYTYDANGNQKTAETADGTLQYGYDGLNRMTAAAEPGMSASYSYGANGLRTSKTVDGVTTTYVWDGDQIVLEQIGSTVRKYIRGLNLAAMVSGTDTSYYLYNAHGDVVQLTDGSGTITKNYAYDAFGCELFPSDTDVNPFRYCGEYLDRETGTYYLRTRYYQPGGGRFAQIDSYWNSDNLLYDATGQVSLAAILQSGNLYTYCGNNPVRFVDMGGTRYADAQGKTEGDVDDHIKVANDDFEDITNVHQSKTSHTQGDTGLRHLPDEEVSRRARDKSLSGEERKRYQKEEKVRGLRNKQKRESHYKSELDLDIEETLPNNQYIESAPLMEGSIYETNTSIEFVAVLGFAASVLYFVCTGDPGMMVQYAH